MTDYKRLYELACQIGEGHARQSNQHAYTIRILRGTIWKALMQLRSGQVNRARMILEQQIQKDRHD